MILIAYASVHGSTAGVAERIAAHLQGKGLPAVTAAASAITSVDHSQAVIVGSAIHNGAWLPEATTFVERYRVAIAAKPNWLFSVGAVGERSSFFGPRASRIIRDAQNVRSHVALLGAGLGARGHHAFAGAISPDDWSALGNVFLRALGGRPGDYRNWAEVDDWAGSIAEALALDAASTRAA